MQVSRTSVLLALLLATMAFCASALTITIPVSKDAQVTYQSKACPYPTCPNEGSSSSIVIGNYEITSEGLFGFTLASIPASANILSASLHLPTGSSPFGSQEIALSVFKLTDNTAWTESTVVWDNKPSFDTPAIGSVSFVMPGPASPLDVTAAVQSEFNKAAKSIGFRVTASLNVFLNSKEAVSGSASLVVTYETNTSGPIACGNTQCNNGDQCCGSRCYNPTTNTCTSEGQLCALGQSSCSNQCYSTAQYSCFDGVLCPAGTLKCGASCYDPSKYQCFQPNNRLCPSRTIPCGPSCIDPSAYKCCNGNVVPLNTIC